MFNVASGNQNFKFLWQLDSSELYSTLQAEQADIVREGVVDVIKILNALNDEQTEEVARRLINGDIGVFGLYRTKE